MAIEKEQRPKMPKGQFLQIFLFMAAFFVLIDTRLRTLLGEIVGFVLTPVIGFDHKLPVLTILLASIVMVGLSSGVRHLFVDWIKMARIQNTMRAFQRAMREARAKRDPRRIEQLQKVQPKLMGLQTQMSSAQMKPMAFTFLIIIPLFAWLTIFIQHVDYAYFASPWNPHINMFTSNGILFGSSIFPHWLLFYTAVSIPFGALVQKALKYFSWRDRWHLIHRGPETQHEAVVEKKSDA